MKIVARKKIQRKPSLPGEILLNIFLQDKDISQTEFAHSLSKLCLGRIKASSMKTKLSEIIKGKRAISAEFAILISKLLGTNPKMWLNLQSTYDLWQAEQKMDWAS